MTDRRFINHHNLNDRGAIIDVDCRFCRLVQKYDKYLHVAPCGCAGPTRYVHRQCLERWIIVKFQHVYNYAHNGDPEQFNIFCEVCQQRMEMEYVVTNKLSKYQDIIEKITAQKILFSTLLLFAAGLLVAIIVLGVYSSGYGVKIPAKYIFGLSVSFIGMAIVVSVFIYKFLIIKSIALVYIGNNKKPMIMGLQANFDEVRYEEQGPQKDPYFGVQASKKEQQMDKSLMLESKRDSGSVVSKTLTDLVMKKMYRHDELSLKEKSEKEFNQSKYNKMSRFSKREPLKMTKDQEVQISDLEKKNSQVQIGQAVKGDKSFQKDKNQLDQQVQLSPNMKDQSIQAAHNKKDVSLRPSFLPKMKRIFREDTSVMPVSSVAHPKEKKQAPATPKRDEIVFISDYRQNAENFIPQKKPSKKQLESPLSSDLKKSEQQLVKQAQKIKRDLSPDAKLKLKTLKDPIKIRVMF